MRLAATIAFSFLIHGTASAVPIFLTNSQNQLLNIDSASPGTITATVSITGLQLGENILGIDFRPANGILYGLGSSSRLYSINTQTGVASQVGASGAFVLSGSSFGFDFNPVPDRIRVVSDTGQNLRLNPNDGSLAATDGSLNPGTPNVSGAAYTNSFAGTASTMLYVIDSTTDQLYIQSPPNNGTLTSVGALGLDVTQAISFDIAFPGNIGYAALQVGTGNSSLYTINLGTGAATLMGGIGSGQSITGLATATPEPATFLMLGLGLGLVAVRKYCHR